MLGVDFNLFAVCSRACNGTQCFLPTGKDHDCISFIFKVSQCSG